ncbi:MAG: hypothetical protein ACREEM_06640 [Blastocatellia bacterium]
MKTRYGSSESKAENSNFPGISDEQIQAVITRIREALEEGWLAEPVDY